MKSNLIKLICPTCSSKLLTNKKHNLLTCSYCQAEYLIKSESEEGLRIIEERLQPFSNDQQ